MNTIEPLYFEYEGEGLNVQEANAPVSSQEWDDTSLYLLKDVMSEYCEEINSTTLQSRYTELIDEYFDPLLNILPDFLEDVPIIRMNLLPSINIHLFAGDETIALVNPRKQGFIYIISNNKNKARSLRNNVAEGLRESESQYSGIGIDTVDVYTQNSYPKEIISSKSEVLSVEYGETGDFEQEIYDELKPISQAFIQNPIIDFEGSLNREYDILFLLGMENILHIAIKDYSGTDETASAKDIINKPQSNAGLIGANTTISVVNGADDDRLNSLRSEAELRDGIEICKKDQCAEKVRNHIQNSMISGDEFGFKGSI